MCSQYFICSAENARKKKTYYKKNYLKYKRNTSQYMLYRDSLKVQVNKTPMFQLWEFCYTGFPQKLENIFIVIIIILITFYILI